MEESPLENIRELRELEDRVETSSALTTTWSSVNARDCRTRMAKIIPMDLLSSLSGKICGHSDISFAKKGQTQYTMKRCNPRSTPYTEAELARQEKFAQARAAVKSLSEQQKSEYAAQFKKYPGKYSTLNGYIFAKEYEKLA